VIVLVVEDNRTLARNMIEFLEAHGIECDYAENGNLALNLAMENTFNAIILDIMLPGKNGISICSALRAQGINTPIIMLTARDTLEDKLQGFDAGADDYLVKPFDLPELVARVKVLTKRVYAQTTRLAIGDLVMDVDLHRVTRSGQRIELNKVCWTILEALMRRSPKILTRQEIEEVIWPDQLPDSDVLKSHIYKLRQLIDKPFDKPIVQTVRGIGLVIEEGLNEE